MDYLTAIELHEAACLSCLTFLEMYREWYHAGAEFLLHNKHIINADRKELKHLMVYFQVMSLVLSVWDHLHPVNVKELDRIVDILEGFVDDALLPIAQVTPAPPQRQITTSIDVLCSDLVDKLKKLINQIS